MDLENKISFFQKFKRKVAPYILVTSLGLATIDCGLIREQARENVQETVDYLKSSTVLSPSSGIGITYGDIGEAVEKSAEVSTKILEKSAEVYRVVKKLGDEVEEYLNSPKVQKLSEETLEVSKKVAQKSSDYITSSEVDKAVSKLGKSIQKTSEKVEEYEYNKIGDQGGVGIWGKSWAAQTWTVGTVGANVSYNIDYMSLYLNKTGSPSGNLIVSIRSVDASGKPTGNDLCSSILDVNTIPNGYAWYQFDMSPDIMAQPNTKYAIVIGLNGGNASNYVRWAESYNTSYYPGGEQQDSSNRGVTWSINATRDAYFEKPSSVVTGKVTKKSLNPPEVQKLSEDVLEVSKNVAQQLSDYSSSVSGVKDYSETFNESMSNTEIFPGIKVKDVLGGGIEEFYRKTADEDVVSEIFRGVVRELSKKTLETGLEASEGVVQGLSDYINSPEMSEIGDGIRRTSEKVEKYLNSPEVQEVLKVGKETVQKLSDYITSPEVNKAIEDIGSGIRKLFGQ